MSLFGTSPEESSPGNSVLRSKSSLFADDAGFGAGSGSSLFADDAGDDSPWSNNTIPKRAARRDLVKTLLPATDVPESYIDAYDLILNSGPRVGAGVGLTGVREILASSGLNATDQARILNLVVPGEQENENGLERNEFNVLLALVGLAQEGEDITLDSVDERRNSMFCDLFIYLFLFWFLSRGYFFIYLFGGGVAD